MKKSALILLVITAVFAASCSSEVAVDQAASVATEATDSSAASQPDGQADADTDGQADAVESAPAIEDEAPPVPTEVPAAEAEPDPEPTVDTTSAAALLGSDDWCTAAVQIDNSALNDNDTDFLSDPALLEERYTAAVSLLNQAVRIAPPVIATDVAEMAEAAGLFTAALEEADWDFLDVDFAAIENIAVGMEVSAHNIEKYNYDVCGIGEDPGDAPVITSDEFDEPLPSGSPRELMVESFMSGGFSEAEAVCLADTLDIFNPEVMGDAAAMFDAFNECGISLDRLSQLGG